jgi:hypothetical protein
MRAIVAASAYAILSGKKVAGIHDHDAGRHRRIAAECRGDWLQAYDGERDAHFGGDLPDLYDRGDKAFVSLEKDGATVRGYDRATGTFYTANVAEQVVQFYDHGERAWFAFTVQIA